MQFLSKATHPEPLFMFGHASAGVSADGAPTIVYVNAPAPAAATTTTETKEWRLPSGQHPDAAATRRASSVSITSTGSAAGGDSSSRMPRGATAEALPEAPPVPLPPTAATAATAPSRPSV
jgi:hypothetical protein